MLIEFRVKNFRSLKDEQSLTLEASADKSLIENTFVVDKKMRLVSSAAIYGANASGKSNVIKAMAFMTRFVRESADNDPEDRIAVSPFLLDLQTVTQPAEFEMTFVYEGIRYQYGFSVTTKSVVGEWLYAYPKGRAQMWFERTVEGDDPEKVEWRFGRNLKGRNNEYANETNHNTLYLSLAVRRKHLQLTRVREWFIDKLHVNDGNGMAKDMLEPQMARVVFENHAVADQLSKLMQTADFGIIDFSVDEVEISIHDYPAYLVGLFEEIIKQQNVPPPLDGKVPRYDLQYIHKMSDGKIVAFDPEDESLGTRRFFGLGGYLIESLNNGSIVVIDELDSSLHPRLARALVQLFHDPTINTKNAQLIFNTHDSTLLDLSLLRRDQIWLTEKDRDGATTLFSILDFSPRANEALSKGYLQGRYGAIPQIDDDGWHEVFSNEG